MATRRNSLRMLSRLFKTSVLFLIVLLVLAVPALAQAKRDGNAKTTHVVIVVPSHYTSNVTVDQAVTFVNQAMGDAADPLCADLNCSMQSWLHREINQVVNYDVTVYPIAESDNQLSSSFDSCGRMSDSSLYIRVFNALGNEYHYNVNNSRTMALVMGAGGWAGHLWASPSNAKYIHWGLVGDWGVEESLGVPNPCIPDWDYPNRGFSHEFAGAMGMFWNGSFDTDDSIFGGDVLSQQEKDQLLHNSGGWLMNP